MRISYCLIYRYEDRRSVCINLGWWDDIDLENRIIKISKNVYAKDKENKEKWYLGTTKTIGSHREVYICDTCI